MLPSGIRIWQPEFPTKILSRKTGAVHNAFFFRFVSVEYRQRCRVGTTLMNVAPLRGEHGSAAASTVFKIQPHLNAGAV